MAKGFFSSGKSYVKNVLGHAGRIALRKEDIREAVEGIRRDTKKLQVSVQGEHVDEAHRRKALRLVKTGRERYNTKDYAGAEKLFRHAVVEDANCAVASLYLGHALYKLGKSADAVGAWQRAYAASPDSEHGIEALRKIQHVQKQHHALMEHLEKDTEQAQ